MSYIVMEYTLRDYGLPGEGIKDTNPGNKGSEMICHPRRRFKKIPEAQGHLE